MRNRAIIFYICMTVFTLNIFAEKNFKSDSDFYFISENKSIYEISDESFSEVNRVLESYRNYKGINLDFLMKNNKYALVLEKNNEGFYEFLIKFDIKDKKLPDFISRNMNFYWDKMYKEQNIAFDLEDDFLFAFDKETLIIANSIELFFETEKASYFRDSKSLYESYDYRNIFQNENYVWASYNIQDNEAYFFEPGRKKEKIASSLAEDEKTVEYSLNKYIYFDDSDKLIYTRDSNAFDSFVENILPEFGSYEGSKLNSVGQSYFVGALDYSYAILDVVVKEKAMDSLVEAIKKQVFYNDYPLELIELEEGIFYVEFPLIYKKVYFSYYENYEGNLIISVSDNLEKLKGIKNSGLAKEIYEEENKNLKIDFIKKIKTTEYHDRGFDIKETERM